MNNKGFSLVEILAVVALLGILSGIAIGTVQKYINKAHNQAYDTLASSSVDAANEYLMEHPGTTAISFEKLKDENYISNISNPKSNSNNCLGRIEFTKSFYSTGSNLDQYSQKVFMCCGSDNYTYDFPGGKKKKTDKCSISSINVFLLNCKGKCNFE